MSGLLKGAGLVGAGAIGMQQVQQSDMFNNFSRLMGLLDNSSGRGGSSSGASTSSGAGSSEMRVLQGEVDRLHKLLSDVVHSQRQNGTTVIHTGGGRNWSLYLYPAVGLGLTYAYCRIRGISIVDLLYVSQNSMTQFKTTVTEGFSRLWDEVRKQKDELMAKLGAVGRKQNQLIESQSQMDERLRQVGDSVDSVKANTHNINFRVTMLDGKLAEVRDGMNNVQQGIMLLVQTVAEVTNRIGMNNTRCNQALKGYIANPQQPQAQLSSAAQPQALTDGNPRVPAGPIGNLMGLNSLLLDVGTGSTAPDRDYSSSVQAAPAATTPHHTINVESTPDKGGPPSFVSPAAKPTITQSARTGAFWGVGRS